MVFTVSIRYGNHLQKGPDGQFVLICQPRGQTPLHFAAANGLDHIIKVLIESFKADVHAKDEDGLTPLHWAALNGRIKAVKILVRKYRTNVDQMTDVSHWCQHK